MKVNCRLTGKLSYLRELVAGAGPDDELKRRFWS